MAIINEGNPMLDTASYDGLETTSTPDVIDDNKSSAVYAEGELFPETASDESYGRWLDLEM